MIISEIQEIDTEYLVNEPPPLLRSIPRGLASIPDSIDSIPHPKPNLFIRSTISFGLWTLHASLWLFHVLSWIIHKINGPCLEKDLYLQLRQVLENNEDLSSFLEKAEKQPHVAGFMVRELKNLPELQTHLKEILGGANIRIIGDKGFFYRRWSSHPKAYPRISSHNYQKGKCYGLGYICFWLDLEGHTRFQFENTPLRGFQNTIYHLIDMLRYWRDNEQQGVAGISPYTESHCLNIPINLETIQLYQP